MGWGAMPFVGAGIGKAITSYQDRADKNRMMDLQERQSDQAYDMNKQRMAESTEQMEMKRKEAKQQEAQNFLKTFATMITMSPETEYPRLIEGFNKVAPNFAEFGLQPLTRIRNMAQGKKSVHVADGTVLIFDPQTGALTKEPVATYEQPVQDEFGWVYQQEKDSGRVRNVARGLTHGTSQSKDPADVAKHKYLLSRGFPEQVANDIVFKSKGKTGTDFAMQVYAASRSNMNPDDVARQHAEEALKFYMDTTSTPQTQYSDDDKKRALEILKQRGDL